MASTTAIFSRCGCRGRCHGGAGRPGRRAAGPFRFLPKMRMASSSALFAGSLISSEFEVAGNLDLPGPAHGVCSHLSAGRPWCLDAEAGGDALLAGLGPGRRHRSVRNRAPAKHCRKPLRCGRGAGPAPGEGMCDRFGEVTSRGTGAFGRFCLDDGGASTAVFIQVVPQLPSSSASSANFSIRIWRAPSSTALVSANRHRH